MGVYLKRIPVDVEISFKDSVFGTEKEVELTKPVVCDRCSGNGAEPGTKMKTCGICDGQGVEIKIKRTILGNMQTKATCATCQGSGEIAHENCSTCKGAGTESEKKKLSIHIPEGIESGSILRVRSEGEAIKNGQSGDLYVKVYVQVDSRFQRQGPHIVSQREIGFTQAALGDKIDIETVEGNIELSIPAGTQSGTKFRLKHKGIPKGHGRGDHYVIVDVIIRKKLSKKQKELIKDL